MNITMSLTQLRAVLIEAGIVASNKVLVENNLLSATLSKAEAYRKAKRENVDRWIKEGLLTPVRDAPGNARWRINRLELDSVIAASNRHTFLNTEERRSK